jgi:hypothetical protein
MGLSLPHDGKKNIWRWTRKPSDPRARPWRLRSPLWLLSKPRLPVLSGLRTCLSRCLSLSRLAWSSPLRVKETLFPVNTTDFKFTEAKSDARNRVARGKRVAHFDANAHSEGEAFSLLWGIQTSQMESYLAAGGFLLWIPFNNNKILGVGPLGSL